MRTVAALVVACVLLLGAGCGGSDDATDFPTLVIVASFYPLAWAADELTPPLTPPSIVESDDMCCIGTETAVENLTPPGVEPHDLELSPSDVALIHDAMFVVYVGGGFQPAVEDAVDERSRASFDVLDDDDGEDPHVWLDPVRFASIVAELGRELRAEGPARDVERELLLLDSQYRAGLEDCARRTFVTTHAAFGALAKRYGLTQVSLAGASPEAEPSPRDLERLIAEVRATGATTVFAEPLVSNRVAETVARETGAKVATLDPIEGLSKERLDAGEDYLSVMRSNLAALRLALGCR